MKAFLLSILLFISSIAQCRLKNNGRIIIQGEIKRVQGSILYVYLICIGGKCLEGDSIKVINNRYTCTIKTDYVAMITFYAKPFSDPASLENKNLFVILAEPCKCKIVSQNSFSNVSVSGSRAFIEYNNLRETRYYYLAEIKELQRITDSLKDTDNFSELRIHRLNKRIDSLYQKNDRLYLDYVRSSPLSLIAPYLLSIYFHHISDDEVRENEILYDRLSPEIKNSFFGNEIKSRIESSRIRIGMIAPEFSQSNAEGKDVSLESFRGKYVLLDFWASWCFPCRGENTHLVKAYNEYHKNGFTIISVSVDEAKAKDKWLKAINDDGLSWTNVSDLKGFDNAVARLYFITSVPQNFLIDPEGKIVAKNLRNGNLEKKLNQIFSTQ